MLSIDECAFLIVFTENGQNTAKSLTVWPGPIILEGALFFM